MLPVLRRHPLLFFFATLPLVVTFTALVYQVAMWRLEGKSRGFWTAVGWAAETLTTTGYGADSTWSHPLMVVFVVSVQFGGLVLAYILVPLLLLPMLEKRFAARLPTRVPRHSGHVVIYRFGPAVETLIDELLEAAVAVVLIEADEVQARRLFERKNAEPRRFRAFHLLFGGSLVGTLGASHLAAARALIVNGDDEDNAAAILVAQELAFPGEIIALAQDPALVRVLELAGAGAVFTPRQVLGAALAARASQAIEPRVDGIHQLGRLLRVAEIRVDPDSFLAGKTLREARLGADCGATVLGQWVRGRLDAWIQAETRLEPRGILVAIGPQEKLDDLKELATGRRLRREGPILVAGNGIVGGKVAELLRAAGDNVLVIDLDPGKEGTDRVGDIADAAFLESLELDHARAMVLALDSDRATVFAALTLKAVAPDLPTIARVNRAENVERIHRAGADFALSVSQVAAQIVAQQLLGRESRALGTQIQLLRLAAEPLLRHHSSPATLRQRSHCSVVAIERGDQVITDITADMQFLPGDQVYLCGHRLATEKLAAELTG